MSQPITFIISPPAGSCSILAFWTPLVAQARKCPGIAGRPEGWLYILYTLLRHTTFRQVYMLYTPTVYTQNTPKCTVYPLYTLLYTYLKVQCPKCAVYPVYHPSTKTGQKVAICSGGHAGCAACMFKLSDYSIRSLV